jgi:hypothetical protein
MVANQGASPSGLWLVTGRDAAPAPLVPGRFGGDVPDACLPLGCVLTLVLRAPGGPALPGALAFMGDFCGDLGGEPLFPEGFRACPYGGVVRRSSSCSSSRNWLEMLPPRTLAPLVAIASPFQFPLLARDRGSGASRSATEDGTGMPLVFGRGMRDVLGLPVCVFDRGEVGWPPPAASSSNVVEFLQLCS